MYVFELLLEKETLVRVAQGTEFRPLAIYYMKRANNFKFYGAFRFMILLAGAI